MVVGGHSVLKHHTDAELRGLHGGHHCDDHTSGSNAFAAPQCLVVGWTEAHRTQRTEKHDLPSEQSRLQGKKFRDSAHVNIHQLYKQKGDNVTRL
ncbi:hypothetical protein PPTG_21001 [Phytophthora nicotianae INRA-310]|uniref:Uncharacterized protein n=1 Tax=Phytophthora nicotianae (strain INRA-310) TaxID=761204 RepID=W2RFR1_PHYN3|nr:hypothetical protein PPTG_21001 [Phytophthora nicotianae INRA-310]ETN23360.1 hypothetical protein PPTG_21001 [Phytophthora nicotianae INRA-310]